MTINVAPVRFRTKEMMDLWFVILLLGILAVAFCTWLYNRLVQLRQKVGNAYAQIDVQLKRRYDLIPQVVEVAKGYMAHERETLEAVVQARVHAVDASKDVDPAAGGGGVAVLFAAEALMAGSLGRLMLLAEDYPELEADLNMRQLNEELCTTENRVAFARQAYNDAVMYYNTARESFPLNLLAGAFHFIEATLWILENREEAVLPRVDLGAE